MAPVPSEQPGGEVRLDHRIALFVDAENFVESTRTTGLSTDIAPVLQLLKSMGRVQFRRAYGDLEKHVKFDRERQRLRLMFHRSHIQFEDIPYMTNRKNTADIRLAVEAISLAYQQPEVNIFAIVASDRDYVPLVNKLRELGRTIIGIGIDRENINMHYIEAFDKFYYFESLIEKAGISSQSDEERVSQLTNDYYELVQRATQALAHQGFDTMTFSAVNQMMRQLSPDFDPALVNCDNFQQFIDRAERDGLLLVIRSDNGHEPSVRINPKHQHIRRAPSKRMRSAVDPGEQSARFRKILENKMRVTPFPNYSTRQQILEMLAVCYDRLIRGGNFYLQELSDETNSEISQISPEIDSRAVFKVLLSLYFARCFHCRQTDDSFNPVIEGVSADPGDWETRLHAFFTQTLTRENPHEEIEPAVICRVLYDSETEEHLEKAQSLLDDD